jgi:hypothetical protein
MATYRCREPPFTARERVTSKSAPVAPRTPTSSIQSFLSLPLRREELPRVGRREFYPPGSYDDRPKPPLPTLR